MNHQCPLEHHINTRIPNQCNSQILVF
uniref:Uncharacterized protein LOC105139508 n=1 Tax=Rhizophora mucronata TaxID=61149 RepID=A0A2P2JRS8_RHIMU